jgi:hypothetical protein
MIQKKQNTDILKELKPFNRGFFDAGQEFTYIGNGSPGGKAAGLASFKRILENNFLENEFPGISVSIPRFVLITTDIFDSFMQTNDLYGIALSGESDDMIAHKFLDASLPTELLGDLRGLIEKVHTPLAVRSSSLLEDSLYEPFAGIYGTKMIPNNQFDADTRFHKLLDALKFVYASTYFKEAKDYIRATKNDIKDEKMAVIIQEVVGQKYGSIFYPTISGVARSYNFYPQGTAKPENGVVDLALGLGKTVVDGETVWTYSPAYPSVKPPFGSPGQFMKNTQKEFWAVNMGKLPSYDPAKETEFLVKCDLLTAEKDQSLNHIASTYDISSDKFKIGTWYTGPKVIDFSPVLELNMIPLNAVINKLLKVCEKAYASAVEIEFAVSLDIEKGTPAEFGFLQVRPMVVSDEDINIGENESEGPSVLVSSDKVLGNGFLNTIKDVIFVKPENFDSVHSSVIADELEIINRILTEENRKYLLIGFGRWGSSDPWLGTPVNWGQISNAKVIVESMTEGMNVELSQGSHFFHNITSFQVMYFSVPLNNKTAVDWNWLNKQKTMNETHFIKHVVLDNPLCIKVDGKSGKGIILK